MGTPSEKIAELEEKCERINQQLAEMKEDYGLPEKVNVTPEQVVILREVLEEFTESQGNATITQLRMWVRENDSLEPNEKVAIQSVLDDLLDAAPEDWRVQGEFSDWLDRRTEEAQTTNVDIPVAGRSNQAQTTEVRRDLKPETETETVEIPAAGRTNSGGTTVEREVPTGPGMDAVEESEERIHEMQVEREQKRVEERKRQQEQMNSGPYALDDDEDTDVPAAGRSNWEDRNDGD